MEYYFNENASSNHLIQTHQQRQMVYSDEKGYFSRDAEPTVSIRPDLHSYRNNRINIFKRKFEGSTVCQQSHDSYKQHTQICSDIKKSGMFIVSQQANYNQKHHSNEKAITNIKCECPSEIKQQYSTIQPPQLKNLRFSQIKSEHIIQAPIQYQKDDEIQTKYRNNNNNMNDSNSYNCTQIAQKKQNKHAHNHSSENFIPPSLRICNQTRPECSSNRVNILDYQQDTSEHQKIPLFRQQVNKFKKLSNASSISQCPDLQIGTQKIQGENPSFSQSIQKTLSKHILNLNERNENANEEKYYDNRLRKQINDNQVTENFDREDRESIFSNSNLENKIYLKKKKKKHFSVSFIENNSPIQQKEDDNCENALNLDRIGCTQTRNKLNKLDFYGEFDQTQKKYYQDYPQISIKNYSNAPNNSTSIHHPEYPIYSQTRVELANSNFMNHSNIMNNSKQVEQLLNKLNSIDIRKQSNNYPSPPSMQQTDPHTCLESEAENCSHNLPPPEISRRSRLANQQRQIHREPLSYRFSEKNGRFSLQEKEDRVEQIQKKQQQMEALLHNYLQQSKYKYENQENQNTYNNVPSSQSQVFHTESLSRVNDTGKILKYNSLHFQSNGGIQNKIPSQRISQGEVKRQQQSFTFRPPSSPPFLRADNTFISPKNQKNNFNIGLTQKIFPTRLKGSNDEFLERQQNTDYIETVDDSSEETIIIQNNKRENTNSDTLPQRLTFHSSYSTLANDVKLINQNHIQQKLNYQQSLVSNQFYSSENTTKINKFNKPIQIIIHE